jgi:hypothetical protein
MPAQALSTYSDELLQAHREAFQALRQIMADALLTSREPPTSPAEAARQRTLTQRLSLRLRAALALLRVRPPAATASRPAHDATLQALAAAFTATSSFAPARAPQPAASLTAAAGAARSLQRTGQGPSLSDLLRAS